MFFRLQKSVHRYRSLPRWCLALALGSGLGLNLVSGAAHAADPVMLRVNVFPGSQNLALFAGLARGFFDKRDLKVELQFTPNSDLQRSGLAEGKFEIAFAAVDNALAMVEVAGKDVVIVTGGDRGMNELLVQPDIRSAADLRGKTLLVDAPNTAYALLAKKILLMNGLKAGDYAVKPVGGTALRVKALLAKEGEAAMINIPFSIEAKRQNAKSLGRAADLFGAYQATGAFVMRPWAQANGTVLERFIAAYVESLRWAMRPENRAEAAGMLANRLKLPQDVAEQTYDMLKEPKFGLQTDANFDMDGFKAVLALRAEIEGQWGGKPPAPDRYLDLGYYERAMSLVGR
jgi:ABC-type nitrate/sulfonate/bicarbonate transport system substrate-binding protein